MAAWPTLFVATEMLRGELVCIAATASKARRLAEEKFNGQEVEIEVDEVPLGDAVVVRRLPSRGALPGSSPAPSLASPIEEPVAPARRGDPETSRKAAEAARRLGGNRRTEILRWIVREVYDNGSHRDSEGAIIHRDDARDHHGITESELTREFGGVPGGNSKRISELIDGAWLYSRGTRPSVTTGTAQRVCFPTSGAIEWVASHPREA